ncbi:AAA family ATPase [Gemmata algarum]|uniref:AAA family ATPase n=1 Tax=Gemmata algarum TaxID=2975278 RepID=UPI002A76382B|nr:AAA family ATPase [Gemmata algarum]
MNDELFNDILTDWERNDLQPPPLTHAHRTAALFANFTGAELRAAVAPLGEDVEAVLRDCETAEGGRVYLPSKVRRAALGLFATGDELRQEYERLGPWLPARDVLQQVLGLFIRGAGRSPADLSVDQLGAAAKILGWFEGIVAAAQLELPPLELVLYHSERYRLLRPLRELIGNAFVGRARDTQVVHDYLDAEHNPDLTSQPPLVVYGVGGVGKSSLAYHALLPMADAAGDDGPFFALLDFDRRGRIDPEVPTTLLVEAVAQLAAQSFPRRAACVRLGQALADDLIRHPHDPAALTRVLPNRVRELAQVIGASAKPYLFVLDTFEEVQHRSWEFVQNVWTFLALLKQEIPSARPIVIGRAPPAQRPIVAGRTPVSLLPTHKPPIHLQHLDRATAVHTLERLGASPGVAEFVVGTLGSPILPLDLRLAAVVLDREKLLHPDANPKTDPALPVRLRDAIGKGKLHRRILERLHDSSVQAIVYPGMVLRQITPDLIFRVLGPEAKIRPLPHQRAREIFAKLAQEVALVTLGDEDVLWFRPEVRREVLKDLLREQHQRVTRIHNLAVKYYKSRSTDADRAEEVYHRLLLGQRSSQIDPRWTDGAKRHLAGALDELSTLEELPPSAQAYLASRFGTEASPQVTTAWVKADELSVERDLSRRVRDLIRLGKYGPAAAALDTHWARTAPHPDSELWALRVRVLRNTGRLADAQDTLQEAIRLAKSAPAQRLLDLLLELARVACLMGQADRAADAIKQADELFTRHRLKAARIDLALARLQALPAVGTAPAARLAAEDAAVEALERATLTDIRKHPRVARKLAAEVIDRDPTILRTVLAQVGLGAAELTSVNSLARALGEWEEAGRIANERPHPLAERCKLTPPRRHAVAGLWNAWLYYEAPAAVGQSLAELFPELAQQVALHNAREAIRQALRTDDQDAPGVAEQWDRIYDEAREWQNRAHTQLLESHLSESTLDQMLWDRFGRRLEEISAPAEGLPKRALAVVVWANKFGVREELLRADPDNPSATLGE